MKKIIRVFFLALLSLLLCGCTQKAAITNELVAAKLETVSELTTARLTYNGLLHYEEGKVPLLTKKAFFMVYCAEVEAGIDLSTVAIDLTEETLTLTLPQPEILSIYVDPESVRFYNESSALFNPDNKEDAIDAIGEAEADVRAKADIDQMLTTAKSQSEALLTGLFADAIDGRTLVIRYQ